MSRIGLYGSAPLRACTGSTATGGNADEFNNTKSSVVTFGETIHSESMKKREWILGEDIVDELYEYKNLGVMKNYIGSFPSKVDDNIERSAVRLG